MDKHTPSVARFWVFPESQRPVVGTEDVNFEFQFRDAPSGVFTEDTRQMLWTSSAITRGIS